MGKEKKYEVIIVGGGSAGWPAAVAAARLGAKTLLIERYGFLGGTATASLVGPFMKYSTRKEQIIEGIFKEFCLKMQELGGMKGNTFDFETYKYVAMELCIAAGVNLLFHSSLIDAFGPDDFIENVEVLTRGGRRKFSGQIYIDCTGDGELGALTGVPFQIGRESDGLTQAMTLMFVVGGVDFERVENYFLSHKGDFQRWEKDEEESYFRTGVLCRAGFYSAIKKAQQEGRLDSSVKHLFFISVPKDKMVVFNTTNVLELNPLDPQQLTEAEIIGRRQVWQIMEILKELPGFEEACLVQTATQIGVRESRRFQGEYVYTGEDVRRGAKFPDVIARGNYGIDIHDPKGKKGVMEYLPEELTYDIPYRCLLPQKVKNLLIAGRCLSATHEGQAALRIQPICMAMGEAAGTAAGLCIKHNSAPKQLNIKLLQSQLIKQGANLGTSAA